MLFFFFNFCVFTILLDIKQVCMIVLSRWCMCILGELETEGGGGGNIKQRFRVLSSHCLDRTPPRANEVFVCQYPFLFRSALRYTHLSSSLLSSWAIFSNRYLKVMKEVMPNYPSAPANAKLMGLLYVGSWLIQDCRKNFLKKKKIR